MGVIKNFDLTDIFNLFGGGGIGGLSRYFTELAPAFSQYYTIPTVTLTGDFEIECEFATTATTENNIWSDNVAGGARVYVNVTTGYITAKIPTSGTTIFVTENSANYADGKLRTVIFSRVGNTFQIDVDGATASAFESTALDTPVDFIGRQANAVYFDGIIANVKITDAGTLVRHYKLDEDMVSATIADSSGNGQDGTRVNITSADAEKFTFNTADNAWIGQELVTNGGFDADTDWTKGAGWAISGGNASSDGTQVGDSDLTQTSVVVSGPSYKSSMTISGRSAGGLTPVLGTQLGTSRTADGTYSEMIASNGTSLIERADLDFVGDVDNVSVKRALEIA